MRGGGPQGDPSRTCLFVSDSVRGWLGAIRFDAPFSFVVSSGFHLTHQVKLWTGSKRSEEAVEGFQSQGGELGFIWRGGCLLLGWFKLFMASLDRFCFADLGILLSVGQGNDA